MLLRTYQMHPGSQSADIDEAEMLARKVVRIMKELRGPVSGEMMNAFRSLVKILFTKNDFTDETACLLEDMLSGMTELIVRALVMLTIILDANYHLVMMKRKIIFNSLNLS
jgi:hypothetical protein